MTDAQKECFEKLFHVAYSVAKRGQPYTDFMDIIELEKLHNIKFFPGGSYGNESACRDFVNSCANLIFNEEVKEKLLKSNFISILCDGSTDSSVIEKECIYVQFVEPSSMKINVAFLSLQDLPSQDASGIYEAIKKAFTEVGLETCLDKIVFLASDGAAVNTGLKNGLIKLLRHDRPWVGFVWCLAHRLELGIKDALSDWIKPVEVNLQYLYYMYEKSSKKTRELKELFSILNEVYVFENQEVKPHRATGTRWIAHKLKSLKNYIDKFGLYIHHIENIPADTTKKTDKATLDGKYRLLVNTKTFLLSCLLVDLCEPARNLSLETQKDKNNLIKTMSVIEVTKNRYERLKNKLSTDSKLIFEFPCLEKVLSEISLAQEKYCYQNIELQSFNEAKSYVPNQAFLIVSELCNTFAYRFGGLRDVEDTNENHIATKDDVLLLHVNKLLHCASWSTKSQNQVDSLIKIFRQFENMPSLKGTNIINLQEQYSQLVDYTLHYHTNYREIEPYQMWSILYDVKKNDNSFADIFEFIRLCFCIPFSNAKVERFFNFMKIIKTDWRSRLGAKNLTSLIRIKVEGPNLDQFARKFCSKSVVYRWGEKQRRINTRKRSYTKRHTKEKIPKFSNEFIEEILDSSSSEDEEKQQ